MSFSTKEVIATANAIFRQQGFVKKGQGTVTDNGTVVVPNATQLYTHFYDSPTIVITLADQQRAEEIVDYFKGLTFKAMERGLTGFEENVLKFVQSTEVNSNDLGIAASLPKVYANKLEQDVWTERENDLSRTSEFVGELKQRCTFTAKVENVRWIGSTNSYLTCCSVNDKDILKFFSDTDLGPVGRTISVAGFVKSHQESKFHGGKETMINRVKVEV